MKRNKFSLSHYKLLTADMGKLYPISCIDVLPGDTMQHATTALIRMQPILAPVMHPINVKIHHWFVPYRLIWESFEDFITGNDTPDFPTIKKDFTKGSLGDYLGLFGNQEVSALPFRAYQLIWNEFYRDQDLQTELTNTEEDGEDTQTNTNLLPVSWAKDYFTTSRPWTQKGSEIGIPVGSDIDITFSDPYVKFHRGGNIDALVSSSAGASRYQPSPVEFDSYSVPSWSDEGINFGVKDSITSANDPARSLYATIGDTNGQVQANLSSASVSVNDLRLALALQRYEEARAKYGSRYVEYLRYLGVRSSDARLQLPEYLGGGKQTIQISEVLNTSGEGILGSMAGHGINAMRTNRYRRFFEEHGVILSLMYIMPKAMYVDGTHRSWLKRTKEDFFQRELQHIGMQEVYTRELKGTAPNDAIFGYQDRYDEYRRMPSSVSGDFRDTLDFWHLGRTFDNDPVLNSDFISNEPTKRIFAEQNNNEFLIMANHSIQARRMLTKRAKTMTY